MTKKIILLMMGIIYCSHSVHAQVATQATTGPTAASAPKSVPSFKDAFLDTLIKKTYGPRWNTQDKRWDLRNNVSDTAFRDTIYPIFSQFVLAGNNIFAKNANVFTAEVTTKETRIGYNAAAYWEPKIFGIPIRGIYNAEIFASGKDNIGKVFGDAKFQGNFGVNVSGSFLMHSWMSFDKKEASDLFDKRLQYFWVIKQKGRVLTDAKKRSDIELEIISLEAKLECDTTTYKTKVYQRIQLLQDSLKKFINVADLDGYYKNENMKFERKNAKWTGFSLISLDVKLGIGSEGFNYYNMISSPVIYPVIIENGKRFTRNSAGFNLNWVANYSAISNKLAVGPTITRFIGFDAESVKEITERKNYDSLNVSRSFDKKYSAYALKDGLLDTYYGIVYSISDQMFFGKKKNFGIGFSTSITNYLSGKLKDKSVVDNTYSLFFALSKKGEALSKNVLSIHLKTPDVGYKLDKSFVDVTTREKKSFKEKIEVGITFGLTIDKLLTK